MKISIIPLLFFICTLSSFGQKNNFEFYGGINLTNPTVLNLEFSTVYPAIGYTLGALLTIKESLKTPFNFQLGLGFSNRSYGVRLEFDRGIEPDGEIYSKNYLHDIEIPALAAYKAEFNNFQLIFKMGLIPGFNVLYKSDIRFINMADYEGNLGTWEEIRIVRPNGFKRLNAFSGISVEKKFNGFFLGIQPNIQYNFLPIIQENSLGPKLWTFGINSTLTI